MDLWWLDRESRKHWADLARELLEDHEGNEAAAVGDLSFRMTEEVDFEMKETGRGLKTVHRTFLLDCLEDVDFDEIAKAVMAD
jgi:hypothetical protein